jgi:DNA-binding NtrC family response regulator
MVDPNVQPIRLLIVDDEPKLALTLAASLEKLGDEFLVDTAQNFHDAYAKVGRNHYALLITDYRMPGLNGLDLARAVRLTSPDTQIVLMTGVRDDALRDTAEFLELAGFLEKPFTIAEVRDLVQRALYISPTVRRVLLIEEKEKFRLFYGQALRGAGYLVYEASSLHKARGLLASHWFDIILCSLDLGGKPVMHFLREQTAKLSRIGTNVIAISSQGGYRSICEELGVDIYLETPVAVDPLVTLVDRLATKR